MTIQTDAQYWYTANNERQGPVSGEALIQLANLGRLTPAEMIWCSGLPDWVPAGTVVGLFASSLVTSSAVPPPIPQPSLFPCAPLRRTQFGLIIGPSLASLAIVILGVIIAVSAGRYNEGQIVVGVLVMMLGGGVSIISVVHWAFLVYRAWAAIQGLRGVSTTPGQALGFLFIPFYNLYWVFVAYGKWAKEYNAFVRANNLPGAPVASEGLFHAFCVMAIIGAVPLINYLMLIPNMIVGLICVSTMCKATNYLCAQSETKAAGT